MDFLFQSSWHLQVRRTSSNTIQSSCHYLDPFEEKAVVLQVNIKDYCIEKAILINLGNPGYFSEIAADISQLKGVSAYVGSGPKLREILEPVLSAPDRELFNQCIIGAFQAESFFYKERGFASAEQYSQAGDEFLLGTCRYYSNLDKISNSWSNYIGAPTRDQYLFDRFKNQQLSATADEYLLIGSLNDTFHQVNTFLQVGKDDQCTRAAQGVLLRVPDQVCKESNIYLQNLTGINLLQLSKKELAHQLGAQNGCVHLIDLIFDSTETLRMYLQKE